MASPPRATIASSAMASSHFDEHEWVIRIRQTLQEQIDEDDNDFTVCIFIVPKTLVSSKPEAYIPHQLALGPYHCWRSELYDMERYKLAAAKRVQKHLQDSKFQQLVDQYLNMEPCIRACYHKYLDFNGETLAWMMAIDASFLLEFLQIFVYIKESNTRAIAEVSSRMSHIVDPRGTRSTHNTILRDIFMLENQIPLIVLRKMIESHYPSKELALQSLYSMVMGLCDEVSPLVVKEDLIPIKQVEESAHLLDFLYHIIVPKLEQSTEFLEADNKMEAMDRNEVSFEHSRCVKQFLSVVWRLLSKLNMGPMPFIKKVLLAKPVQFVAKLPWEIITRLPGFALFKQPVEYFFFSHNKEDVKPEDEGSTSIKKINEPPMIKEIMIPSVTELMNSGVQFALTNGDITSIQFDKKTFTLHLPTISLDVNTEVMLRNLVAYEASKATGQLALTSYIDLMNGIIDTEEDAKLLREKGIVLNRLKSDLEVAEMWKGMNKWIKLTKVPFLDRVIEDVNKHYSGRWKVKLRQFMKVYVFASWQFLTLVAAIFLLLLTSLQAFCSVYSCGRVADVTKAINPS